MGTLVIFVLPLLLVCCTSLVTLFTEPDPSSNINPRQDPSSSNSPPSQPRSRRAVQVYNLTPEAYHHLLQREERVIVLVTKPSSALINHYYAVAQQYRQQACTWFYLPLHSNQCKWVEQVLGGVSTVEEQEKENMLGVLSKSGALVLEMALRQRRLYVLHYPINNTSPGVEDVLGLSEDNKAAHDPLGASQQFTQQLQCWLDRVNDGSLAGHRVQQWPNDLS